MNAKLSLVGSGIKTISHLSKETESHINSADIVLYLINEPVLEEWIRKKAKESFNLEGLYFSNGLRRNCYNSIRDKILEYTEQYNFVCVVLYGHPTVFSTPGLEAIREASLRGLDTKIVPAISAADCLFADLRIDPSDCGCFSIEATGMLMYQRSIDVRSHLIVWQLGMLCNVGHKEYPSKDKIRLFVDYLSKYYSKDDLVVLYEASLYPGMEFKANKILLKELVDIETSKLTTLYIPPVKPQQVDSNIVKMMDVN